MAKRKKADPQAEPQQISAEEPIVGADGSVIARIVLGDPEELPGMKGPGVARVRIPEVDAMVRELTMVKSNIEALKKRAETFTEAITEIIRRAEHRLGTRANGEILYRSGPYVVVVKPGKDKLKVEYVEPVFEEEGGQHDA
jgi:hypothetical protein